MIEFSLITCCSCGTRFQIDSVLFELRQKDSKGFSCPNGHKIAFTAAIDRDKELEKAKARITELEQELAKVKNDFAALEKEMVQ